MNQHPIRLLAAVFLLLSFKPAGAQSDSLSPRAEWIVSISPAHLVFRNGLHLEVAKKIKPQVYVHASPIVYSGKLDFEEEGRLSGAGLQLGFKRTLSVTDFPAKNFKRYMFASASAQFVRYQFSYEGLVLTPVVENGTTVYRYLPGTEKNRIHQTSLDLYLGWMMLKKSTFYAEVEIGVAYRYADIKATNGLQSVGNRRDDIYWDFGYTGLIPLMQVKLGFYLNGK